MFPVFPSLGVRTFPLCAEEGQARGGTTPGENGSVVEDWTAYSGEKPFLEEIRRVKLGLAEKAAGLQLSTCLRCF